MDAQIAPPGSSPVRIDACGASYGSIKLPTTIPFVNYSQKDTNLVNSYFDFTNVSGREIDAIRFGFRELDTFGGGNEAAGFYSDWNGTAQPSQSLKNSRAQGYNMLGGVPVAKLLCFVVKVRFADGSVWSARGTPFVKPGGLYYPPTPAPTDSPWP
jgi:hypothetical protein